MALTNLTLGRPLGYTDPRRLNLFGTIAKMQQVKATRRMTQTTADRERRHDGAMRQRDREAMIIVTEAPVTKDANGNFVIPAVKRVVSRRDQEALDAKIAYERLMADPSW